MIDADAIRAYNTWVDAELDRTPEAFVLHMAEQAVISAAVDLVEGWKDATPEHGITLRDAVVELGIAREDITPVSTLARRITG